VCYESSKLRFWEGKGGVIRLTYSTPFALESVSRRETAVQGQTAVTHVRYFDTMLIESMLR